MTSKKELILRAYELLDRVTPLYFDCGTLCCKRCCDDDVFEGSKGGMVLLPGEDELLCGQDGFQIICTEHGKSLICSGSCNRGFRPFMCRIFPFYPKITYCKETDHFDISLRIDPLALSVCPIARHKKGARHSVYFHRNAVRAVRILLKDKEIAKELTAESDYRDEMLFFYSKMI